MKLAGMIFILTSAWSVGCRFSSAMKFRCELVKRFMDALRLLRSELSFFGSPLSDAYFSVSRSIGDIWGEVFEDMAARMEKDRWLTPVTAAERAVAPLKDEAVGRIMMRLAQKLGSYDLEVQLSGIDCAVDEANRLLHELQSEKKLRSKTYKTLSICTGAALAILLS